MAETRLVLPESGQCSCGCKDLMLAIDQTEYTPVTKDGGWQLGASSTEQADSGDPMGNVRFFCTGCGTYFVVPEELA